MVKGLGKVALALSGGGALGIAHIGALKAFGEFNLKPAVIAGTSAGSIIGAMAALQIPVSEMEKIVLAIDKKRTVHLLSPTITTGGLLDLKNFITFLEEIFGQDTLIEDLEIPFIAVAVDFQNGNILYLNRGRLVDAVRASIAVPGIFTPVEANGTLLVDGGLRDNLPLRVLKEYPHDTLIGVNVLKTPQLQFEGFFAPINLNKPVEEKEADSFFERITHVIQTGIRKHLRNFPPLTYITYHSLLILISELSNKEIQLVKPDLVVNLNLSKLKIWEFWRGKEAIDIGYRETKEQLQNYLQ